MKNIIILLLSSSISFCQVVKSVHDGDTYKLDYKIIKFDVRLLGVDCPEVENKYTNHPTQHFGINARDSVSAIIKGKKVSLSNTSQDRYGRVLASIKIKRKDLAKIILINGWGWATDSTLLKYQKLAQKKKIGLWANPSPINPRLFRK